MIHDLDHDEQDSIRQGFSFKWRELKENHPLIAEESLAITAAARQVSFYRRDTTGRKSFAGRYLADYLASSIGYDESITETIRNMDGMDLIDLRELAARVRQ